MRARIQTDTLYFEKLAFLDQIAELSTKAASNPYKQKVSRVVKLIRTKKIRFG
jgi:hypothetical protein